VCSTCWASSYTAPSTHPPDTLPMTSPPADTASAAPGSRGALENVRTTVARPNVSPASHHFSIWPRMSRTPHPSTKRSPARPNRLRPANMPGTPAHLQYVAPRPAHRPRPRDEVARPGGQRGLAGRTYSTILEIGIDRRSRAPAAFSFGISVLTLCLGTTVSTA